MIIIVTKQKIQAQKDTFIINNEVEIIDDYHLSFNNQIIEFDYLLFDDYHLIKRLDKIDVMLDDGEPVVNYYGETTLENIFYGNIQFSLNYLRNGD